MARSAHCLGDTGFAFLSAGLALLIFEVSAIFASSPSPENFIFTCIVISFGCKINIIEYNPIDNGIYQQADREKVDAFANFLSEKCNLIVNVRRSRGKDIDAACGQLANKNKLIDQRVLKSKDN